MAGDETAEEGLLQIIQTPTEDVSTRAEALRAYARVAKEKAIPMLETLSQDKTPGPDPLHPPLAIVASDELYWLRHPDRRVKIWDK